jgi:quercetin dioxygenase-like cupin family protein
VRGSPTDSGKSVDPRLDLTRHEPRGLTEELEGYAWLPRMLDKARAVLAGTAGHYQFGCPVDHTCMARLGITPEVLLDLVAHLPDDHAVLGALRAQGIPPAAEVWFDGQGVEDELQNTGRYLRVRDRQDLPEAESGRVFSGAQHGARVSVVLIDAEPDQAQEPHAHTTEEVLAIQDGEATFFLGRQQARIVRAGEVVRIPAGVPHRWVAGHYGLRALAAYGAAEIPTEAA